MWRSWLVVVIIAIVVAVAWLDGQERGYVLAIGTLEASESERGECYFAVGRHTMIAVHPQSTACVRLHELLGTTGQLIFVPD